MRSTKHVSLKVEFSFKNQIIDKPYTHFPHLKISNLETDLNKQIIKVKLIFSDMYILFTIKDPNLLLYIYDDNIYVKRSLSQNYDFDIDLVSVYNKIYDLNRINLRHASL